MQEIELEITSDLPEKAYSPGEKIKGEVKAIIHEEWQCDALTLFLGVKGFSQIKKRIEKFKLTIADDRVEKLLFQGQWSPGRYVYPFEIIVPQGPLTYKGSIIELSWYLRAVARPIKGESVTSELEPNIVPGTDMPEETSQEKMSEIVHKELPKGSMGCLGFSLALFIAGVLGAIATYQYACDDSFVGFAFLFALVSLGLIILNLYMFMVSKRINMVEVRIGSGIASPGDIVSCNIVFQVNKQVKLKEVRATLTCREEAGNIGIRARGKSYKNILYEKRHELQLPVKEVPANVPIFVKGEISVPSDAPSSFVLANSFGSGIKLKWIVECRIEMKWWPDWFHREEITVRSGHTRT
jgi:hypothetical protein